MSKLLTEAQMQDPRAVAADILAGVRVSDGYQDFVARVGGAKYAVLSRALDELRVWLKFVGTADKTLTADLEHAVHICTNLMADLNPPW